MQLCMDEDFSILDLPFSLNNIVVFTLCFITWRWKYVSSNIFFLELIKKKVIFRLSQRPAALQLLLSLLRQQHLFNYHQKTVSIRKYIFL